ATSVWRWPAAWGGRQAGNTAEEAGEWAGVGAVAAAGTAEVAGRGVAASAPGTQPAPGTVGAAAVGATDAPLPGVSDGRRRADPQWDSEPRPAEAATELSER